MSLHREVQTARDLHGPPADHSQGSHANREAAHLLRNHSGHGHLRDLPSNPAAAAATPHMEIGGIGGKGEHGGDQAKLKDHEKIVKTAGQNLVDDLKNPANGDLSDRTYRRIEGLVQSEFKDHGVEGVQQLGKEINGAFIKAQEQSHVKGPPATFEFGKPEGNLIPAQVVNGRSRAEHLDFGFPMK